ncbi:hypothetical protein EXIGLDRAFT_832683 [Exidia glandulosa HHB12029]|uniref:Hamartin-domain-containing protein n=1 Tax=Exidia glandulosa HHB12029 TaxID=1314781 RepID=A0A165LC00_EXIGL|nr:hypothetical protein EXIGLDRAFT_832683 [Exidia glandulosa HHB12029]
MDELADDIFALFAEPPSFALSTVLSRVADVLREDPTFLPAVEDVVQDVHRVVRFDVPAHHHNFIALLALPEMHHPEKVVSTWTELALQAVLKHTRLDSQTLQAAKELAVGALAGPDDALYVSEYRKRVFQLYLLDAPSDTSGPDAVDSAAMDEAEKESKKVWKENLGDILIAFAMRNPNQFCRSANVAFGYSQSRLELLNLFRRLVMYDDFDFAAFASSELLTSILLSLTVDNSTSCFTVGLTIIVVMLPHLAVKSHELLVNRLPSLLAILARALCSNGLQRSDDAPVAGIASDDEETDNYSWSDSAGIQFKGKALAVDLELHWERLEASFVPISSRLPSADHYFTFLYGMYPCNTVEFLRRPTKYMQDRQIPCPFVVGWQEVLEDSQIRARALTLARRHALSPWALSHDIVTELSDHKRWSDMSASDIISQTTALDVVRSSSAAPASRPVPADPEKAEEEDPASAVIDLTTPHRPRISVRNMMAATMVLKSSADIEITDYPLHWPAEIFAATASARRASRSASVGSYARSVSIPEGVADETASISASIAGTSSDTSGDLPARALQAVAILQREALLLRNELNYQLWLKRGLLHNIARLQRERNVTIRGELERQNLRDKRKEFQAQNEELQAQLKKEKQNLALVQKNFMEEANLHLSKRKELRDSKKAWEKETASLRQENKEHVARLKAQSDQLDVTATKLFMLETQIKETASKVERLEDYEKRIEQHTQMQKLWDADVQRYKEQKEQIEIMVSNYGKMQEQLASLQAANNSLMEERSQQQNKIIALERELATPGPSRTQPQNPPRQSMIPNTAQQLRDLARDLAEAKAAYTKQRADNAALREQLEEMESIRELTRAKSSASLSLR